KVLHSPPYVQALLDASDGQSDPDLKEVHAILQSWDGRATVDNRAVAILETWQRVAKNRHIGPDSLGDHAKCLEVLKQTVEEMKRLYGKISVPLAEVQVFTHGKDYSLPGHD